MASFTRTPSVTVDPSLTAATISWEVDTPSYGQIGIDPDPNNLVNRVVFDSNFTTAHSLYIDGLLADTEYWYIVHAIDADGNPVVDSEKLAFRTSIAAPPAVIDGPTSAPSSDSVDIAWSANVEGAGLVYFGTAPTALDQMVSDPTVSTDHVVTLQGLRPSTAYSYQCCNSDPTTGKVLAESAVMGFTTEAAPPPTGGRLLRGTATPRRVRKNATAQLSVWLRKGLAPISGAPVTFQLVTHNGSIQTPATSHTDATGKASATFVAGAKSGFVLVKATSPNAVNNAFILLLIRRT